MTTLADLAYQVRDGLKDFPKRRTDKADGDASTTLFDLGKDLAVITGSDVVSVSGVGKTRNVDYTIDYDGNQLVFTVPPAVGVKNVQISYKEAQNRDEKIYAAINSGRRMLYMRHYQQGVATVTVSNLVRQYDLALSANEAAMRTIFSGQQFAILRGEYQPNAVSDGLYVPFRAYEIVAKSKVHLWRLLPAAYTLRFHLIYDFLALVNATDVTDIPDQLQDLVVWWALGTLALKKESERDRQDTANTIQGTHAIPPGMQAQTSEDFTRRWLTARNNIPSRPPTFVEQRRPMTWQV